MCEHAEIRFVHYMEHKDYPEVLGVGCICASNMEEDYTAAAEREQELRSRARRRARPEVAAAMRWVVAADAILALRGALNESEETFVEDMRERMGRSAEPRVRDHYQPSTRQRAWMEKIYRRVVLKKPPAGRFTVPDALLRPLSSSS